MCGIVGYTGFQNAVGVVFDGLKTLEYRGYDSAGIAVVGESVQTFRSVGRVSALKDKLPTLSYRTAIGHTRWATHGVPLEKNAHPHVSFDGKIAIVHNGIIENFKQLQAYLTAKGIKLSSDTDSEVIAHLLALERSDDFQKSVAKVSEMLKGAATFLAVRGGDDGIYCSKRGASLSIGLGKGENFVASDTLAICSFTSDVIPLKDGDVARISANGIKIWQNGKRVFRPAYKTYRAKPVESDCFMASEISEIPRAVGRTIDKFFATDNAFAEEKIRRANRLFFIGCGTAYHACLYAKHIFSHLTGKICEAVESSEFDEVRIDGGDVAVFISQSGETADTVIATKRCKKYGGYSIAVCNVQNSLLSFTADATYYIDAGAEVAVAATKSYVSQLALLYMLAKRCADSPLPDDFKARLTDCLEQVTNGETFEDFDVDKKLFFIGKGQDVVTAKEAALKVKEITCKMTDAYPAGELKHGPIALIDDKVLAVVVATAEKDKCRIEATTSELISRGATVFAVSGVGDVGGDSMIELPIPPDDLLFPLVAIIPLEKLALDLATRLGLNPDKPRNLAKSVTVV